MTEFPAPINPTQSQPSAGWHSALDGAPDRLRCSTTSSSFRRWSSSAMFAGLSALVMNQPDAISPASSMPAFANHARDFQNGSLCFTGSRYRPRHPSDRKDHPAPPDACRRRARTHRSRIYSELQVDDKRCPWASEQRFGRWASVQAASCLIAGRAATMVLPSGLKPADPNNARPQPRKATNNET